MISPLSIGLWSPLQNSGNFNRSFKNICYVSRFIFSFLEMISSLDTVLISRYRYLHSAVYIAASFFSSFLLNFVAQINKLTQNNKIYYRSDKSFVKVTSRTFCICLHVVLSCVEDSRKDCTATGNNLPQNNSLLRYNNRVSLKPVKFVNPIRNLMVQVMCQQHSMWRMIYTCPFLFK